MYDQEYLNYLRALLLSMTEYGIVAYIVRSEKATCHDVLMGFREFIKMSSLDTAEEFVSPHACFGKALNRRSQVHQAGLLRLQALICPMMEKN